MTRRASSIFRSSILSLLLAALCLTLAPIRLTSRPQQDQSQDEKQKELQKQMQEMLKKMQDLQKTMGGVSGLSPFGQTSDVLQQQCTVFDKQNPLRLCLPVRITVIDDVDGEVWEQKPSGLLPNREPKYIAHKRRLAYTAEGKGKLLYKKD